MYTLHWSADSGAFAPHAMLSEVGADFQLIEVNLGSDQHYTPEFLSINPRAQVPVLTLPDGTLMTESVAMMMHLADCHPETGKTERAIAYRWLLFGAVNLYETGCRIGDTHHYSENESDYEGIRAKALGDLDRYWDMVAEAVGEGPFLLGELCSVADICFLMLSQWHPDLDGLTARHPSLTTLRAAVRDRPAIDKIWDQNFA